MRPRLLIIRGLPGSGKSTAARKIAAESGGKVRHFENDAYLIVDGKYVWTPETAKAAARRCFDDTMAALRNGADCVVSNVFVTVKSVMRYVTAAKRLGAETKVVRLTADRGNVHDVPAGTLESMRRSFEDYPGETVV